MSDRAKGYLVVLETDLRIEDDGKAIQDAILMIRGVQSCVPVPAGIDSHVAEARARRKLQLELWDVLRRGDA